MHHDTQFSPAICQDFFVGKKNGILVIKREYVEGKFNVQSLKFKVKALKVLFEFQ